MAHYRLLEQVYSKQYATVTEARKGTMGILQGKRIFIVEDDMMNMVVYNATLRKSGADIIQDLWTTDTVHSLLCNLPVDVILLDLMLRFDINGYDTYDKIQSYPELRHIPVVIVSAADPAIEIPKAQAKGLAGFIGKPIQPSLFASQILSCINREPVWYARDGLAGV